MNNNIRIDDELVFDLLSNTRRGSKNHLICDCPLCGKTNHFYFNQISQKWDCKKCGKAGDILYLLSLLGKLNLIRKFVDVTKSLEKRLISLYEDNNFDLFSLDINSNNVRLPIGFKFIHHHPYLQKRGFEEEDYYKYQVGATYMLERFRDYVIFPVFEDKQPKAYVARKTWDKQRFLECERNGVVPPPRYSNSKNDLHLLLYGIDEIMFFVDTVILVEGLFTKKACDKRLGISEQDNIRCLATFGKKISPEQILKLILRGIKNVIILFDEDAVTEAAKYGQDLSKYFENVLIGFVNGGDLDECSDQQFDRCFRNLMDPFQFKTNIIAKKKLI